MGLLLYIERAVWGLMTVIDAMYSGCSRWVSIIEPWSRISKHASCLSRRGIEILQVEVAKGFAIANGTITLGQQKRRDGPAQCLSRSRKKGTNADAQMLGA